MWPLSHPQVTPGAPLPRHGHPLGLMVEEEWQEVVEKAVIQYSREKREVDLLIFTEVGGNCGYDCFALTSSFPSDNFAFMTVMSYT